MRMIDMSRRLAGWAGWAALAFVAFTTLSPIAMRPVVAGIGIEHFGAFAAIGFLFGIAHPRRLLVIVVLLVCATVMLEVAQFLVPGRHGRALHAAVKIGGAVTGLAAAWVATRMVPALQSER